MEICAMTRDYWQLTSPVGYSYQTMDQLLLSSLQWDNGGLGLRVENLPIEGSNLRTAIGTGPTVGMVLRLVTNEARPAAICCPLVFITCFRAGPQMSQMGQPLPAQMSETAQQTPYGLPPMNAVKTILPQFHSLYNAPRTEPVKEYVPLANVSSERGNIDAAGTSQIPPEIRGTLDIRSLAIMDYQMKEVDRYRTAMRKMATDLLHVREDCKRLEEANSRLRRELGQHDEISRLMVSSKDMDNVTHSELVQKFALLPLNNSALKKKLADESTKRQEQQTRLQRLQNDLIKKNEMEKEFLKLQEAHEGQQALLQKLQKTKTIQDTCKKQEKVIVQLEQLLAKQGKGQYNGESSETYRTLSDENIKLQAEVMQYKELLRTSEAKQKKPRSPGQHAASNGPTSDVERLELFEKLEKAEGRILALEKQLADNVRKWAKDKAELQMKLNESLLAQKTGYKNSSTSIDILDWHNGPKPVSPSRSLGPRRPSPKLDPLWRR
ncbi:Coiled-coil domain-containing protein 33 [Desmophyllum pertusum]|uniref:Coiled-coil domain-containing protein 33 n=1 Tax=Desmophyllum pertusum TaxID=174260 RepID=A0A9W9YG63_9CNID|nr:Coiled-coil domain-containing protein 33 [Desmophyllum pertusum]